MEEGGSEVLMYYKGYEIDSGFCKNGFTVFFCGDELFFDTEEQAKAFIDEIA